MSPSPHPARPYVIALGDGSILIFDVDPVVVGVNVGVGVGVDVTQYLVNQWLDTYQVSWIYNWDITKYWLYFGDIDLIFKATAISRKTEISWWEHLFSHKILLLVFLSLYCGRIVIQSEKKANDEILSVIMRI